jgi:uncharacterized protein YndB with AHSA1/START domain
MENAKKTVITVETIVERPVADVWKSWTEPDHIVHWNSASDDWHTTAAQNDLRVGGSFLSRMEAKDGSFGFDFGGVYDQVKVHELIEYTLGDGRKVQITFVAQGPHTKVIEAFEAEAHNPIELQQRGWQMIMDHFKKYTENYLG